MLFLYKKDTNKFLIPNTEKLKLSFQTGVKALAF